MDLSKSTLLLCFIGLFSFLKFNLKLLNWLHVTFYSPSEWPHLPTSYGSWAVVIGATDFFGLCFANDLAREGLNLVLVGSSPDRLTRLSSLFQARSRRIQVKTIVLDFTSDVTIGMSQLAEVIGGLDVGLLVNCACLRYLNSLFFFKVEEWVPGDVVKANVEGTTMVTRAAVAGMAKRGRGVVVNVVYGDSLELFYPLHEVFSATKEYVVRLSESLSVEYKQMGIDVQYATVSGNEDGIYVDIFEHGFWEAIFCLHTLT